MTELADFHSHLMPGVDDGAVDEAEAAAALGALREQGVRSLITTPHIDGSLTLKPGQLAERLAELDRAWSRLQDVARQFPDMTVMRGTEVMLDTPDPDLSDPRLRLDGGSFVLVEFGFMTVPPNSAAVLRRLRDGGIVPVLAHPERYAGMRPGSDLPAQWREAGALLQMNAGSISGRYGPEPRANAQALLGAGLVDFICSDYHARGKPALSGCLRVLTESGAAEQASLLMSANPRRMFAGEMPLPIMPVAARSSGQTLLRRLFGR